MNRANLTVTTRPAMAKTDFQRNGENAPELMSCDTLPVRNPKVCIFTETYYPVVGGTETQARSLAEGLRASGFSVIVVTRRSDGSLQRRQQLGSTTIYRLPPSGSGHLNKWGLLLSSIPALIRLRRQYDVIFVSGFRVLGISAILVSRLLGKACVLKADSLGEMSGAFFRGGLAKFGLQPTSPVVKPLLWIRNAILRRAHAFVAISSAIKTELTMNGVSPDRIWTIPNSVDIRRFQPATPTEKLAIRKRLGIPSNHAIAVFTGRLVTYKGLPLLLRVWSEIQRKHANATLLLVGSGGLDIHNCEANLKEFVTVNEMNRSVHFVGSVHNVHQYLQAADLFVFPTESEAFGIALIEAMACGLPVISTSIGGVKDIIEDRRNGFVVKPKDFDDLYHTLDTLLADQTLATQLARSARTTVEERYSETSVISQYVELFRLMHGADALKSECVRSEVF